MFEVNYLAVLAAAIASMGLAVLWYSPLLFGKRWLGLMGIDVDDKDKRGRMKKEAGPFYVFAALGAFVTAYILALFFLWLKVNDVVNGTLVAIFIWIGFFAMPSLTTALFERGSKKLWVINAGFFLASLVIMEFILVCVK